MDWVKLHTRYYVDDRVEALDDAAELLFVRGLARAGEIERVGFIPESSLPLLARRRRYEKLVSALVESGLWTRVDGGYRITAWSDWQDSADALAERRTAERERQRRRRERLKAESALSRDNGNPSRDVTPTEGEEEKELGVGVVSETHYPRAREDKAPPNPRCQKHPNGTNEPCGKCADARRANEAWQAQRRAHVDSLPKCRKHRGQLADNCARCASERKGAA